MKVLEINKKDLKNNIELIKKINSEETPKAKIYAVVKANGVGLDLIQYSKFLLENGIDSLAVATYEEAIKLRKEAEIKEEILMLSPIQLENELKLLIENDITLTIGNLEQLEQIKKVLKDLNKESYKVHLKVDTGFGRYGFLYTDKQEIFKAFETSENVEIEGMFMHCSKPIDEKWTKVQFTRFMDVVKFLEEKSLRPKIVHAAASTAFLKYPEMRLDAVRIGSLFQGRTLIKDTGLVKVGEFKSVVAEIKTVPKGYNISYGNAYKTKKETKIAVIPVGYIDGLNRIVQRDNFTFKNNIIAVLMEIKKIFKDNSFKVKINGKKYKILGRLGMYHAIIDITDSENINPGDEVILDIPPVQTNEVIRREYV